MLQLNGPAAEQQPNMLIVAEIGGLHGAIASRPTNLARLTLPADEFRGCALDHEQLENANTIDLAVIYTV